MTMQPVRVRFAPSPTGFLHLGTARTALYSALSRSVDLGGPGSFALARCSPPNAKE